MGKTTLLERLKVTEFSTKPQKNNVGSTRRLTCPAPKRYSQTEVDDNEEEMAMNVVGTSQLSSKPNGSSHVVTQQSSIESLEDVSLETPKQVQDLEPEIEEKFEEFNVKKGSSMLPMVKIRPTSTYFFLVDWFHDFVGLCVFYHASHFHFVSTPHMKKKGGTNLAKVSICGCKCSLFDVSGKFQDLWVKYYGDADAVIFCWRLGTSQAEQQKVLESVRRQIDDEIPVLIFGHRMNNAISEQTLPTSTKFFIPHYTSNMMQVYCGSAKTGQGVREAMEWLVPLAKRQAQLKAANAK